MPVQKISVAAVQDETQGKKNGNGSEKKKEDSETAASVKSTKSTPSMKDKRRKSFNRTKSKSGISKVSSVSSGLGEGVISRRADTPPPQNICRICHCEGEEGMPLMAPCLCTGTMRWVHMECLNTWIRSSDTICCELCMYVFIMQTELKPLAKWEGLEMTPGEKKVIFASVFFHVLAVMCMSVSVYALVRRTLDEIEHGMDHDMWRTDLARHYKDVGLVLEWPFWTKVAVVVFGVVSGAFFLYIQAKYYYQMFRKLRSFNRIITVQDCLENVTPAPTPPANGKADSVEVAIAAPPAPLLVSERGSGAAVAPVESPV